ncbi:hypothetical protein C8C99_0267 [Acidovorax sp. 107]|uniref:hypothetical protein n=1 Tax=Acidovorax sp. 107 TaxID=2135638 RepID=UPI000D3A6F5E|nr:hypothetical protein [Acidovorax sp. 107]PUA95467.1 hypothetical protein C8C99_0267 [Acidovorax sp. 107]
MTDIKTPSPSDAEIAKLYEDETGFDIDDSPVALYGFARAVLAKWGQPVQAGEPVARLEIGKTKGGVSLTHIAEPAAFQLQEGMYALYTTPQPTQAQAGAVPQYRLLHSGVDRIEDDDEFLSDDTTTWAIDPNGIFSGNIYGGHVLRPARRRIKGG